MVKIEFFGKKDTLELVIGIFCLENRKFVLRYLKFCRMKSEIYPDWFHDPLEFKIEYTTPRFQTRLTPLSLPHALVVVGHTDADFIVKNMKLATSQNILHIGVKCSESRRFTVALVVRRG